MRRHASIVALAFCVWASVAPIASAHQGNPNFRSIITAVTPRVKGVSLQVLNLDDRLELTNHSGRPIVAYGYEQEPYVRILGDGTVQVNQHSPATYLNQDRFATVHAPASANPAAAPLWQTVDKTGRYDWHDHRIHYMASGTPPQVKNTAVRTKVFDWQVPIQVGAQKGAIAGQLFWQPRDTSGPPAGAIVGFLILLLAGGVAVFVTRRRRADAPDEDGGGVGGGASATEAW